MSRDVTITSTTDTPEAVAAAMGLTIEPAVEPEAEEVEAAGDEGAEVDEGAGDEPEVEASGAEVEGGSEEVGHAEVDDTEAEGEGEQPTGQAAAPSAAASAAGKRLAKRKMSLQAQINKLTFETRSTQRERDQALESLTNLTRQLDEVKAQLATASTVKPEVKKPVFSAPEPTMDQFDDIGKYIDAKATWIADKKIFEERQARTEEVDTKIATTRAQDQANAAHAQVIKTFTDSVNTAKARHKDWDKVAEKARDIKLPLTPAMMAYMHASGEIGGEILYYLATHEDECRSIANEQTFGRLSARMGRVEERVANELEKIKGKGKSTSTSGAPVTAGPSKVAHAATRTPAPPSKPAGGRSSTAIVTLENASYQDFKKVRNKAEMQRRGRAY